MTTSEKAVATKHSSDGPGLMEGHDEREIDGIQLSDFIELVGIVQWRSWRVFPTHGVVAGRCTCSRGAACQSPGKHPATPHGVKDASGDVGLMWQHYRAHPDHNWALACGVASGVVVIDVDAAKGGFESVEQFELDYPTADLATLTASSGGGGRHLMYRWPSALNLKNRVGWLPGVDVRSDGGYVVLPPSRHLSGRAYEWVSPFADLADMPPELARSLSTPLSRRGVGGGVGRGGRSAVKPLSWFFENGFGPEGFRDDNCYRLACSLWRKHWGHPEVVEAIIGEVWRRTPQVPTPFPWPDARRKIDGAREFVRAQVDAEVRIATALGGRRG